MRLLTYLAALLFASWLTPLFPELLNAEIMGQEPAVDDLGLPEPDVSTEAMPEMFDAGEVIAPFGRAPEAHELMQSPEFAPIVVPMRRDEIKIMNSSNSTLGFLIGDPPRR